MQALKRGRKNRQLNVVQNLKFRFLQRINSNFQGNKKGEKGEK
jgi:hypothetical protein